MAQLRRFQVQFEIAGDGKVQAAFTNVAKEAVRASKAVDQAGKSADDAAARYAKMQKQAKLAGAVLGTAFVGAMGLLIRNTIQAEYEQAQLGAVLKSTGEAAGFSQQKLNDMAASLSKVSTLSSGEITDAQTRLLSYSAIVGENFPRALQLAIDQSARLGESVTQSAETVGKALEYPAEGVAALTKQGFRFTEEQKKMLKVLEETGRLAEAQALVMGVMEESYKGAAMAARNTLGGALKELTKNFNDLMTGDSGGEGVKGTTAAINDLAKIMGSSETKAAFAQMTAGLASIAAEAVAAIPKLIEFNDRLKEAFGLTGQGGQRKANVGDVLGGTKQAWQGLVSGDLDTFRAGDSRAAAGWLNFITGGDRKVADFSGVTSSVDQLSNRWSGVKSSVDGTWNKDPEAATPAGTAKVRDRTKAVQELTQAQKDLLEMEEVYADIVGMTAAAQTEAIIAEGERMKAGMEAAARARESNEALIDDMRFEIELIGMTNDQRERAIAQKRVEGDATDELRLSVDQWVVSLQRARREAEFKSELKGLFVDIGMDIDRASESVDRFFDNLKRRALEALADAAIQALLGKGGDGKKNNDGFWANFGSNLASAFDGKREMGGPVRKGSFYEVAEGGKPELLHDANGRTFLIPGSSGTVVPAGGLGMPMMGGGGGGSGGTVVIVENHGAPIEVQRQETQRAPDGRMLTRLIVQTTKQALGSGDLDGAMGQAYGVRRQVVAGG